MGTFGSTARKSAIALSAALLLAGISGCSSGDSDPEEKDTDGKRSAPPTGAPTATRACAVKLPESWRKALGEGEIEPADEESREVLTEVGPGGAWTVLQSSSAEKREIALLEGERQTVAELADPVEHQIGSADYDGQWLAYDIVEGRQLQSPWKLYAWDKASGKSEMIAEAALNRDGTAVPGPLIQVAVRSGRLFWAQGTGDGKSSVFAQDLGAGGERETLFEGVADTPFTAGGMLVWLQGDQDGRQPRLAAVSQDTLKAAKLPPVIAKLRDIAGVASDGRTWAWVSGEQERKLMVWRTGWPKPLALVRGTVGGVEQVQVSGDLVSWRSTEAAFALDLRSRSYTQVTPQYGYTTLRDGALGIAYVDGEAKDPGSQGVIQVARASQLEPLPRC